MNQSAAARWVLFGLLLFGAAAFGAGMDWGLPSREMDQWLGSSVHSSIRAFHLSGGDINRYAGNFDDDPNRAADVAAHPILDRDKPVTLVNNQPQTAAQDDVNRARILLRYRLYSNQPDEMITFRSLAQMHPGAGELDPKLYQYGGLWIYPVGALIKFAGEIGVINVTSDRVYYLDHPESFAKFYIIARSYSAAWGLVAVGAVFALVRRWTNGVALAVLAGLTFICMPVVLDLAHEAKPHLAGTALLLLAVLAALNFVETGKWKWMIGTAILCGAAAAMVLTAAMGIVLIPLSILLRRVGSSIETGPSPQPSPGVPGEGEREKTSSPAILVCVIGLLVAVGVYFVFDPYVLVHLVRGDRVLSSNVSNTTVMYGNGASVVNAIRLVAVGASWPVALAGAVGMGFYLAQRRVGAGVWLIGVPAVLMLVEFALFAGGKPGEYARFALFPDSVLLICAFTAICRFLPGAGCRVLVSILLLAGAVTYSTAYERGFLADNSRATAAGELERRAMAADVGPPVLLVKSEPAPYCLPPVDLFAWKIVLLPRSDATQATGVLVTPDEAVNFWDPRETPISWANKRFIISR